jgi:hypothetical protein
MKELKDVNIKELKVVIKELNDSGLIKKKIGLVGVTNQKLLDAFTEALGDLPENKEVPQGIADFYNDLYADEIEQDITDEDEGDITETDEGIPETTDEEIPEEELEPIGESDDDGPTIEEDEGDITETDEEIPEEELEPTDESDDDGPTIEEEDAPTPVVSEKPAKKKTKPPVVRGKTEPKTKTLGIEKRAEVNPKLSLTKKVAGLLNFKDGRYKITSYFPLDVETIRVLEGNVGLYPAEVLAAIKQDKKAAKKIEKFTEPVLIREINKIKSAYSYIVGAIREDRVEGKLRIIMTTLLAGKEVAPEIGHYTTVKIARRALLAYMEVTGVDHKTMTQVKDKMVEKAATKPAAKTTGKPESKPAAKSTPVDRKKEAAKTAGKPAPKATGKSSKK